LGSSKGDPDRMIELTGHISLEDKGAAAYRMLPFDVPQGIVRMEVEYSFSEDRPGGLWQEAGNILDIGIFDSRGSEFLTAEGFRGWSGSARRQFFLGTQSATPGYLPGPMPAGRWEVILGVHRILAEGCDYRVTVKLYEGDALEVASFEPRERPALQVEPRWYRGELHCHTHHSEAQGSLEDLIATAKVQHLDFVAVTEHNTVSHLPELWRSTLSDLLFIPGMEITTDRGHANVWGIDRWLEFRCTQGSQIAQVVDQAHSRGVLISVNHPKEMGPPWTYGDEAQFDCLEVWQLAWFMFNDQSLVLWDSLLKEGHRIVGVGGSDYHQEPFTGEPGILTLGTPCNWVYAEALSEKAVLAGIKAGHVFISENPRGPCLFLEAESGSQRAIMGDELRAILGAETVLRVRVEGAAGCLLRICSLDDALQATIDEDAFTHEWRVIVDWDTYFRAEVIDQSDPAQRTMRALTNPVYIRTQTK
jgi:hypothetical protein